MNQFDDETPDLPDARDRLSEKEDALRTALVEYAETVEQWQPEVEFLNTLLDEDFQTRKMPLADEDGKPLGSIDAPDVEKRIDTDRVRDAAEERAKEPGVSGPRVEGKDDALARAAKAVHREEQSDVFSHVTSEARSRAVAAEQADRDETAAALDDAADRWLARHRDATRAHKAVGEAIDAYKAARSDVSTAKFQLDTSGTDQ